MSKKMTSFKPYLFSAWYEWLTDNYITPHLVVDASVDGVKVPQAYVKDNNIVLSMAPAAIHDYQLKSNGVAFKAMFRGISEDIFVPFKAMIYMIAVENGQGFPIGEILDSFSDDEDEEPAALGKEENKKEDEGEPLFSLADNNAQDPDPETKNNNVNAPSFEIVKD